MTLYGNGYSGTFNFEPLIVSCTPCPTSSTDVNSTTSSSICTPYDGVFRSPGFNSQRPDSTRCFPSGYSGAFSTNATTTPCCSTRSNTCSQSTSSSYSGVFRPTSTDPSGMSTPSGSQGTVFPSDTPTSGPAQTDSEGNTITSPPSRTPTATNTCSNLPVITTPPDINTIAGPFVSGCGTIVGTGTLLAAEGTIYVGGFIPISSECVSTTGFASGEGCGVVTGTGEFT